MPPRYAYWTILAGGLPTAFRAAEREDLMPTFRRLLEKHPDAAMKWFARGTLWDSQEDAQRDTPPPARPDASKPRGRNWRPGGEHRDPRQPFIDAKKARNLDRRKVRFERRQRADERPAPPSFGEGETPRRPDNRPPWRKPAGDGARPESRSDRPARDDRAPVPRGDGWKAKPRGDWKPKGDTDWKAKPRGDWKPKADGDWKPRADADRAPKPRGDWKPKGGADWKAKPRGDWKPKGDGDWKPRADADRAPKPRGEWKPKGDAGWKAKPRGDWKPKADGDRAPKPRSDWKPKGGADWKAKPRGDWKPKGPKSGGWSPDRSRDGGSPGSNASRPTGSGPGGQAPRGPQQPRGGAFDRAPFRGDTKAKPAAGPRRPAVRTDRRDGPGGDRRRR